MLRFLLAILFYKSSEKHIVRVRVRVSTVHNTPEMYTSISSLYLLNRLLFGVFREFGGGISGSIQGLMWSLEDSQ